MFHSKLTPLASLITILTFTNAHMNSNIHHNQHDHPDACHSGYAQHAHQIHPQASSMDGGRFHHDGSRRDIFKTHHGSADAHFMDSGRFQQDGPSKDSFNNQRGYPDAYFMHGGRLLQDAYKRDSLNDQHDYHDGYLIDGRKSQQGATKGNSATFKLNYGNPAQITYNPSQMITVTSPGNGQAMMTVTGMSSQGFSMSHNGNQFTWSTHDMASTSGFGVRTVNDQNTMEISFGQQSDWASIQMGGSRDILIRVPML
ncbi:hypothetical protein C8J56DRAFT_1059188 [Mycena floridula]|nr:hypothetical protein C8J56DRAFT_1059188 [Mycena floridula]